MALVSSETVVSEAGEGRGRRALSGICALTTTATETVRAAPAEPGKPDSTGGCGGRGSGGSCRSAKWWLCRGSGGVSVNKSRMRTVVGEWVFPQPGL